jgi:hypothetical protein
MFLLQRGFEWRVTGCELRVVGCKYYVDVVRQITIRRVLAVWSRIEYPALGKTVLAFHIFVRSIPLI